jgi:predicted permease
MSIFVRIGNLFSRSKVDSEIYRELAAHIELRVEDNIAAGMSRKEARRDALLRLGNPIALRERTTEADVALYFESFWADVRFAIRQLRKSPGFAIAAVLALSMGIGAASAIFSVIETVLLRPLPFDHQERLVYPYMKARTGGSTPSSVPTYYDERTQLTAFDAMAGYSTLDRINLELPNLESSGASGAVNSISLPAVKTTDNFFDVFGVAPILGRTFLPGEDVPAKDDVAVLSYEVWKTNFAGDRNVVGRVVHLDGNPYTVVGVMPAGFRFPMYSRTAIYTPLHAPANWRTARGFHWMRTVGRMKAGVTLQQAQADITRVMANLGKAYPEQEGGHTATLIPLAAEVNGFGSDQVRPMSGPVRILALAVMALLGIACVNVAGLLLARGVKREREMALRAAVGAGRKRLIRQMVNESLVLAAAGLAGGLALSWGLLKAMNVFLVAAVARGADVHLNWKVVALAAGASVLTTVGAALAPALRLSGADPNGALRAGASGAGTGRAQHRLRSGFVITQVALSLVLLMVAGLLLRNLQSMLKTDVGFDAKRTLSVAISLSRGRYEKRDPLAEFYQPLLERVGRLPGVRAAGLIDVLPVAEWGDGYEIHITGQPPYPTNAAMGAETRNVSAGYFAAMGIELKRGRLLSPALDRPEILSSKFVINEAFRRKFFTDGGDPVGAHIDDDPKPESKSEIVGVVSDIRQDLQSAPMPEMDWLIDAIPAPRRLDSLRNMFLVVRTSDDAKTAIASVRDAMRSVDPTVPFRAATMDDTVSEQLIMERMESWLFGIFAGFALLLAVIGLYGLVSHEVQLETRETGIRMALGATRAAVLGRVMRRVAVLMILGTASGWVLALALNKVLASVVELHAARDLGLLAGMSLGLAAIGILTSIAPARLAASIDPMQALRQD